MTIHGAAHVGGNYHVTTPGTGSFIRDGFELIKGLGFGAVKLFMSRLYASDNYSLESTFSGAPTTLAELAQQPPFAAVLGDAAMKHFILNVFPFTTLGDTDPWKFGLAFGNSNLLEKEYTEIKALAEHLLTTYNGDAKTFVFKSWEGDWSLQGNTALDANRYNLINHRRIELMVAYFRARWQGILDARKAVSSDCVVLHAIEANRVAEAMAHRNAPRMLNRVLPKMRGMMDIVSWSCYDGLFDLSIGGAPWGDNQAEMISRLQTVVPDGIRALQDATGAQCMLGEWGIPEDDLPGGYVAGDIIQAMFDLAENEGVAYNIYWQVFDNEGNGYMLYDNSGAQSLAGAKWSTLL